MEYDNDIFVKYIIIICMDLWVMFIEFLDDMGDILRNVIFNVIGMVRKYYILFFGWEWEWKCFLLVKLVFVFIFNIFFLVY